MHEVQGGKMMLLPPPEGHCRICAVQHQPGEAHDAQSVFYGVRFKMRYGREGTWADAVAHLTPAKRDFWKRALQRMGAEWTEPSAGVAPIAEPIDG